MSDNGTYTPSRGAATLLSCLLLSGAGTLLPASAARAEAFGEIGKVGQLGTGPGEFKVPSGLAVDPTDNSVYVVDANGPSDENDFGFQPEFRVQKFASTLGAPVAKVTLDTPAGVGGGEWVAGLAVDPTLKRLYVLIGEGSRVPGYQTVASEIRVYSTTEETISGMKTLPVATGPGITAGVLHKFSYPPPAADTIRQPVGMAFDPQTGGLLVLGSEGAEHTLIDSVSSTGTVSTVYDDTGEKLGEIGNEPTGLSVGPDGTVYVTVKYDSVNKKDELPGVVKLSPDFTTVTQVHQESGLGGEFPVLTGGRGNGLGYGFGPQVAVNPEGTLVYAMQESVGEMVGKTAASSKAGSYEVRGMSTATGAQEVVYGGGTSECLIASNNNAIAAGKDGIVYALDEGNIINNLSTSYGDHLIEFGPNGGHCPAPVTSMTINENENSSEPFNVEKGAKVEFAASTKELHNDETPTKLMWEAEGPETPQFKEEATGNPATLTASHRFLKPGLYMVTLDMTVSPATLGSPAPVTRKIKVESKPPRASFEVLDSSANAAEPKPGEAVTFDAEDSYDPLGACSEEKGCGETHDLKSYTWNFGDGSEETTTERTIAHTFANPSSASLPDTVTLTVTNDEGVESTPTTQTLTIQGTQGGGGGGGGNGGGGGGSPTITPVSPASPIAPIAPVKPKPLTNAQKLAIALKACGKDRSKKARRQCEKVARAKYAPKPKPKEKAKKK